MLHQAFNPVEKSRQRIKNFDKEMIANPNYKHIEFPLLKNIIIRYENKQVNLICLFKGVLQIRMKLFLLENKDIYHYEYI